MHYAHYTPHIPSVRGSGVQKQQLTMRKMNPCDPTTIDAGHTDCREDTGVPPYTSLVSEIKKNPHVHQVTKGNISIELSWEDWGTYGSHEVIKYLVTVAGPDRVHGGVMSGRL